MKDVNRMLADMQKQICILQEQLGLGNYIPWFITGNYSITENHFLGTIRESDLIFKTFNEERARITSAGLFGINTDSPSTTFDINGQIRIRGGSAGAGKVLTSDANGLATWETPASIVLSGNNGLSVSSGNVVLGQNVSQLGNPAALLSHREIPMAGFNVVFTGTGNIGIGTNNPTSKLHIVGVSDVPQLLVANAASQTQPLARFTDSVGTALLELRTKGTNTIFLGVNSGASSTGSYEVAIGNEALRDLTTGTFNTAIGAQALRVNTTGGNNTAIAPQAMFANTTGSNNVALAALQQNTTGNNNTALGADALNGNITGNNNTSVGRNSGRLSLGSGNVYLGYEAGRNATGSDNLYISNSSTSTPLIYGNFSTNILNLNASVYIGPSTIPTAKVHISAGTATAGTAPLKLTTGVLLTTPENGAVEYDGVHFYGTIGSTRVQLDNDSIFITANKGLSVSGNTIQLGQDVGAVGNPALINETRQIPFTGSGSIQYISSTNSSLTQTFTPTSHTIQGTSSTSPIFQMLNATNSKSAVFSYDSGVNLYKLIATDGFLINNKLGVSIATAPTARLELPGGTATAGTAPLKIASGTALTTTEDGALEYHGSHLWFTIGSTRHQLDNTGSVSTLYLNPKDFGAVGDGINDDTSAIQDTFDYISANPTLTYKIVFPPGQYLITSSIQLPGQLIGATESPRIEVEGYGAILLTTAAITIFERLPVDQTEALDDFISNWIGVFTGLTFQGNSTTNQIGVDVGATYSWVFENCTFRALDTGLILKFCLQGSIKQCRFQSCKTESIVLLFGESWGGTDFNSASNCVAIDNTRVFGANGAASHIRAEGANGLVVRNFISEGFNPEYNIIVDSRGSTTVTFCDLENLHIESDGGIYTQNTMLKLRAGGVFTIKNLYAQYPNLLFDSSDTAGSATIIFDRIAYTGSLPAVAFNTGNPSAILGYNLLFQNMADGDFFKTKLANPASWVDGVVPTEIGLYYQKGGGTGALTFWSGGSIALDKNTTFEGRVLWPTDDFYPVGGVPGINNSRPVAIYAGSTGVFVDNAGKYNFGSATTVPDVTLERSGTGLLRVTGKVGVGLSPTAQLHLPAGTATANTAPLKLSDGILTTTAEAGTVEKTTDYFYATPTGTDRRPINLGGRNGQSGTTYTIVAADFGKIVGLSNTAARTITLVAANSVPAGFIVWFKDEAGTASTGNITINRVGADTIDGATSVVINQDFQVTGLYSDGTSAWFVI